MSELKPGNIVYIQLSEDYWIVTHFVKYADSKAIYTINDYAKATSNPSDKICCYSNDWLTREDYYKKLSEPKAGDLLEVWNNEAVSRCYCFAISKSRVFTKKCYLRDAVRLNYWDHHRIVPKSEWPHWAPEIHSKVMEYVANNSYTENQIPNTAGLDKIITGYGEPEFSDNN